MARARKPSITSTHPGTAEVAKLMGWTIEVVRVAAALAGCPRVRGGKGIRFVSLDAFRAWFDALPEEQKIVVPEVERQVRLRVAEEVAALTWQNTATARRLARRHGLDKLKDMRDRWRDVDDEDQGMRAAREVAGGG